MTPTVILTALMAWLLYRIWHARPAPPAPGTAGQDRAAIEAEAYDWLRGALPRDDRPGTNRDALDTCEAIWNTPAPERGTP